MVDWEQRRAAVVGWPTAVGPAPCRRVVFQACFTKDPFQKIHGNAEYIIVLSGTLQSPSHFLEALSMPTNKKAITVYLDERLYEWVATVAKADGRSISNFVENSLASMAHPEIRRIAIPSRVPPDRKNT